jgi:NADH:ubiquinone oxidoreductase subunit 2 (subunit N)
MLVGLMISCGLIGVFFYIKMIHYFITSKTTGAYPPVRMLKQKAIAMGAIGTIFIVFCIIFYFFI